MLTDLGKSLAVAVVVLWAVSRMFGVRELAMAAVAVLVLLVISVVYTVLSSANLTASRFVQPPRLFFDTEGSVEIRLRNAGRLPTATLQVEDAVPATLTDGSRFVLSPVAPGRSVVLRYRLLGRQRGRFDVGPLHVRLRDPFGIAARRHRFGAVDTVTVYPPVWRLPPGLPLGGSIGAGGEGKPRPLATGEDLANVREYVRGDDLRKVHWRSTAHRAKLMVRQDEAPQNPRATVVLDTRPDAHHGIAVASSFESAVSAAASATLHVSERGYAATLLTQPVTSTPRALPWELVLEQLATVELDRHTDLGGLWQQLATGVADAGLLIAVVAVPEPALLRQMVRAGRGFGTRVAVLVDATTYRRTGTSDPDVDPIADALRSAGWRVTVLGRGQRLDERWRELILQQRTRTGAVT